MTVQVQLTKSEDLQNKIDEKLGITQFSGYKFITSELKSREGNQTWEIGKWYKHKGELKLCRSGFHSTETPLQSLEYIYGDNWCIVETRGKHLEEKDDKQVWGEMRVVKIFDTKAIVVRFAILCAGRALHYFEEKYPEDDRPRKAIEAAQAFVNDPSESAASAAAAWSAARSAARSAAWSAESAASAASAAAAWSAESAARSAEKDWQNETLLGLIYEEVLKS